MTLGTMVGVGPQGPGLLDNVTFTPIDISQYVRVFRFGLLGINDPGEIVGSYTTDSRSPRHGFLLGRGNFITIDGPGATWTEARGINASGEVVGFYFDGVASHGFIAHSVP